MRLHHLGVRGVVHANADATQRCDEAHLAGATLNCRGRSRASIEVAPLCLCLLVGSAGMLTSINAGRAKQFAQGDLLIERVADASPSGRIIEPLGGVIVLAEGEITGHRHAICDRVVMFRDDNLARDVPSDLYVGHPRLDGPFARVEHDEHSAICQAARIACDGSVKWSRRTPRLLLIKLPARIVRRNLRTE